MMRFIHINIVTVILSLAFLANAQPSPDCQLIRSKPSGDLILEVWLYKTHGTFLSTNTLAYDWLTVTNKGTLVYPLKDEYFCLAQMFDSAGNAVPFRWPFRKLGKHFFDVKYPSTEQLWPAVKSTIRIRPLRGTQPARADILSTTQKHGEGRPFYTPDELFEIKKPGIYKLKLQFQVFERFYRGGQTFTLKLERFEPFEITVTKE
jgi:hypothetical protein